MWTSSRRGPKLSEVKVYLSANLNPKPAEGLEFESWIKLTLGERGAPEMLWTCCPSCGNTTVDDQNPALPITRNIP